MKRRSKNKNDERRRRKREHEAALPDSEITASARAEQKRIRDEARKALAGRIYRYKALHSMPPKEVSVEMAGAEASQKQEKKDARNKRSRAAARLRKRAGKVKKE